jgi:signal transduction histidine kinase/CheY-like chemotaxis protein
LTSVINLNIAGFFLKYNAGNKQQPKENGFALASALCIVAAMILALCIIFFNKTSLSNLFIFFITVTVILSLLLARYIFAVFTPASLTKEKLNYSQAFFQSTLDACIIFDKETKEIIECNKRAVILFDVADELSIKGLYLSQLMIRYLSDRSINLELLMNDIPDGWHGEATFRTQTKAEFEAYISSITYFTDGKGYQMLIIRDISSFKMAGKELASSKEKFENSAKVKTRFLAGMSHELRTPLNGIIGTANLILAEKNLPDTVISNANLQLYSSEHMLSIINDILDYSKIDEGKMEINNQPFNLLKALQAVVQFFESQFEKRNIELVFKHGPQLKNINILSDEVKLRQVLNNLISNALKFTIQGKVTLTALIDAETAEEVSVSFIIKDTGIGIKKEQQVEIFESFAQVHANDLKRRFGGTGLGLTISEKLVNLFGGTIVVESDLGHGASFGFTLLFKKDINLQPQIINVENYTSPVDIRGVRILVVEDNEINATVLNMFLKKWGIRTKEAGNGLHAIELLKFHQFDLILMDLEMPEMNGYAATKIIRETDTSIPIIAFTATLLDDMDNLITKEGFNDYILKPFKPADLKKIIEKFAPNRKIEYA